LRTDSKTIDRPVPASSGPTAPIAAPGRARTGSGASDARKRLSATLATMRRYPELALLAALLLVMSVFSRSFSQAVSVGPIYITEVVMALVFAIAAVRHGVGASVTLLRRLPLPALAVIWFLGAIATIRGLSEFGLSLVTHDVGLVDYTLLLPILALVVVDRERHQAMFSTLVACGFAGMATFVMVFTADQISGHAETLFSLQGSAAGLYMSFAVAWIAARLTNGVPPSRWLVALIPIGLVLMSLTGQRSVWVIAFLALGAIVLLAPRERRLRAAASLAVVLPLSLGLAVAMQLVLITVAPAETTGGSTLVRVDEATPAGDAPAGSPGSPSFDIGAAETRGSGNLSVTSDDGDAQLTEEIAGLTNASSEEGQNIRWRLAYWSQLIERVPEDPILGAGFGRPADFYWQSRKYDFRDGAPLAGLDVAGPHNSFVNFLWRLGIPAFLALLFVIGVALARVRGAFRGGLETRDRVTLTTLVAMVVAAAVASSFNEGLTGPFLGIFFWIPLGMLLLWPATRPPAGPGTSAI